MRVLKANPSQISYILHMPTNRFILQIHCPDQKGLIAGTTQVLAKAGANITDLQQHTAKDIETFFLRAVFDLDSNDIQELTDTGSVCRRPAGNTYVVSDDRWALEFFYAHRNDTPEALVKAVLTNEQMWGQDLTKIPGLEEATVANLKMIREKGAKEAYASCL